VRDEVSVRDEEGIKEKPGVREEASVKEKLGVREEASVTNEKSKFSAFIWRTPGHKRELRWLSVDEVRHIHYALVDDFSSTADPINPPGVRSEDLLSSAVHRPRTALGGTLKYPTVETSAAALLHSIILDHPFHNGNKRTSLVSVLVFLDENGFFPDFDQDEVFKLLLQIAQHGIVDSSQPYLPDREVLAIAEWFVGKCRFVEKGERPLSFHKVRQILASYGCNVSPVTAGKVNITRGVVEQSSWGIFGPRKKRLQTQMPYSGDGREVPMSTIKKIRKDLYLDEHHAIDSHAFYSKEPPIQLPEFIARYRKTLDRLAKF
jgi:death-on-curing family protein